MYESIISAYESTEKENPKIIHTHTVGYRNIYHNPTPWWTWNMTNQNKSHWNKALWNFPEKTPWSPWDDTSSKKNFWSTIHSSSKRLEDELEDLVKSSTTQWKFTKSSTNSHLLLLYFVRKLAKDHNTETEKLQCELAKLSK